MSGDVFVDTNVLVYARDASEGDKQARAAAWLESLWESGRGRTSVQVLQEYYAVVTRKLRPGLPAADARADVRSLAAWGPVPNDLALIERAWELEDAGGLSYWDAMIVAAAQRAHCDTLLTEDLQTGRQFGGVRVVSPFEQEP